MKKSIRKKKAKKVLWHEEKHREKVAGWFHIGYAVMGLVSFLWHVRGAREHFLEIR